GTPANSTGSPSIWKPGSGVVTSLGRLIATRCGRRSSRDSVIAFILAKPLCITKRCQAGSLHTSLTGQQLKGTCSSVLTGRIHGFGDSACPRPNRATHAFAECLDAPQSLASTFPSSADC